MGNGLAATATAAGTGSNVSNSDNKNYGPAPAVPSRRPTTTVTKAVVDVPHSSQPGSSSGLALRSVQTQPSAAMAVIATVSTTSSKAPSCAEKFYVTQTMPPANKVVVNYPTTAAAQSGVAAVPIPPAKDDAPVVAMGQATSVPQQVKDVKVTTKPEVVAVSGGNPIMRTPSMKDARKNAQAIGSDVARDLEKNLTELLKMNQDQRAMETLTKPAVQTVVEIQPPLPGGQAIYPRSKNLSYSDIPLKGGSSSGKVPNGNLLHVNKNNILPLSTTTKYLLPTTSSSFCYKSDGAKGMTLVNKAEDLQRVKQDLYNSHEMMKRNKLKTVKEVSSSSGTSASGAQKPVIKAVVAPGSRSGQTIMGNQQQHQYVSQLQQQSKQQKPQHYPLATSSSIGWFPSALQQQTQYQMMGYPQQQQQHPQQYALIKKPSLNQGMNFNQMTSGGNHSNQTATTVASAMMMGAVAGGSTRMLQKSATQIMVNVDLCLIVYRQFTLEHS